ncbi:MAG: rhamnan synthesis F family protein [Christensenellales bacterium]|nr:rhamnan synthesis F family protein [Christensenellales bacterium]
MIHKAKESGKSRVAVFFFYDKQGVADRYVFTLLRGIASELKRLLVVVNGELSEESQNEFRAFADAYPDMLFNLLIRENEGFDVWAYKKGIEYLGWTEIEKYDEMILFNFTIMGPVYPFSSVFEEMDKYPIDFWGLNIHYGAKEDPFGIAPYGYLPKHLQSHFISFRKTLLSSACFHEYWENIPMIGSYQESVALHESFLTKYFSDQGFTWDAFTKTDDLQHFTSYPLMDMPVIVLRDRHCPIFKRKSFFADNAHFALRGSVAKAGPELLRYLSDETNYDISQIYENIMRATQPYEYAQNLNVIRIMKNVIPKKIELKIAVFVRIGQYGSIINIDQVKDSFPEDTHWFIADEEDAEMTPANLFTGVNADWNNYDVVFVINPPDSEYENERYTIAEAVMRGINRWFATKASMAGLMDILREEYVGMAVLARPSIWADRLKIHWKYICNRFCPDISYPKDRLPLGSGMGIYAVKSCALRKTIIKTDLKGYNGTLYDMVLAAYMKRFLTTVVTDEAELMDFARIQEWRNELTEAEWRKLHDPTRNVVHLTAKSQLAIKQNKKYSQQKSKRAIVEKKRHLPQGARRFQIWWSQTFRSLYCRFIIVGRECCYFLKRVKMTLRYNLEKLYGGCGGGIRIWLRMKVGEKRYGNLRKIKRRLFGPHEST